MTTIQLDGGPLAGQRFQEDGFKKNGYFRPRARILLDFGEKEEGLSPVYAVYRYSGFRALDGAIRMVYSYVRVEFLRA